MGQERVATANILGVNVSALTAVDLHTIIKNAIRDNGSARTPDPACTTRSVSSIAFARVERYAPAKRRLSRTSSRALET